MLLYGTGNVELNEEQSATVARLAGETGVDPLLIADLYSETFARLQGEARIVSFLPILAERTVRETLAHNGR